MKTVLVTGCSSGTGRATARAFVDEEWAVYATARDAADIQDLADAGCETAELDVTDDGAPERVVERVVDEQGRLDCLVNNAGYAQLGPVADVPVEDLHRQFDVNVYGPHRMIRAVLPHMRAREDGTIVNVSSASGVVSLPGSGAYSGSKFALEATSDALRGEVAEDGIDVVVVQPGPVESQFDDRAMDELESLRDDGTGAYDRVYEFYADGAVVGGQNPLASPAEEVAEAILDAGVSPDPPSRIQVGTLGRLSVVGRYLPDAVRDAGYRLLAGLR